MEHALIVIEGMDNSGKSTLAEHFARRMGMSIQESEGPPKSQNEIAYRLHRYSKLKDTIFVRHPCVSNLIYDKMRPPEESGLIDPTWIDWFYNEKPLLIYCDPLERGLEGHLEKGHDSAVHLVGIKKYYPALLGWYREWAIAHAHIIYRIGDDMERVLWMLQG